jgi:hypothetical protein
LRIENIVVCTAGGEAAQIQMPTAKAATIALEELRKHAPHAEIGKAKPLEGGGCA